MSRLVLIGVLSLLAVSIIDGAHIVNKRNIFKKGSHFLKNTAHSIGHVASDAAHGVAHAASGAAHGVAHGASGAAHDVAHVAKDAAHDVAHFAKDAAHDVGHFATHAAHDVAHFTEDAAHEVADFTQDAAHGVAHVVSDAVDDLSDFVINSIDDIKDFSHASQPQIKKALKWLNKEYKEAKKVFEQFIHSKAFSDAVKALAPMIDGQMAVNACTQKCNAAAGYVLDHTNLDRSVELNGLVNRSCPSVCKGALTKLKKQTLHALLRENTV